MTTRSWLRASLYLLCLGSAAGFCAEAPSLYGIHDAVPVPSEYLNHITNGGSGGWVTATVAVGSNPADQSGNDFTAISGKGHTVIGRLNYGYYPDGSIPLPGQYDNFAQRCANFVSHSTGCNLWLIGNETNLGAEWPWDGTRFNYLSPQDYAACFRKVYNAIKAVRPNDKVMPQALAPWAGPYGAGSQNVNGTNCPTDGQPLTWVQYLNQMLTAISSTGPLDGIPLHVGSRGYTFNDIHSTNKFGGLNLYASFYVYKDWIDYGIPNSLYNLPLYITECNGLNYWKGGGPPGEDPSIHYVAGWMQEVYAEINSYNQTAAATGKPIFRCVNMYRWCDGCDGWNIDGTSDLYRAQILSDLDASVAQHYAWPTNFVPTNPPPAPSSLTSLISTGKVTLNWNTAPTAASYNIKRSTANGGPYTIIASNVTATAYDNTFFNVGTTYYYVVSAVNVAGESTNSTQAVATPTNGLPDVVVTSVGWSPANPFTGSNVIFRATVMNQGSAPTPAGVTLGIGFFVDGSQVSYAGSYNASVAVGGSVTLNADGPNGGGWLATPGSHALTAVGDDVNRFAESLENNNSLSANFGVFATGYSINGGGGTTGAFTADVNFSGGNAFSVTNAIDTTGLSNAAPQAVYQTERWGNFTYTLNSLVPGGYYAARLHFAEISPTGAGVGARQFNVAINGTQVLTNFDIFAAAGGSFRATTRQFSVAADNSGQVAIQFSQGPSNLPKVSGIEVFPIYPPVLATIPNKTINEGATLSFTALGFDSQPGQLLTDFESFATGTSSVMFRVPSVSSTSSGFLDPSPNISVVTASLPAANGSTKALNVNWGFKTGTVNPWLRLTTQTATGLPNPIVDFAQAIRFDIFSDKDLAVALGLRETNPTGAIGADGGIAGSIEFVGVPAKNGSAPVPSRMISAGRWTTLQFNLPREPIAALLGNGVLDSTTGKGVLEHLALVPAAGLGAYNVYLDNFAVVPLTTFTYTLSNAPVGATINATNGLFSWTPSEAQAPGSYDITVQLTKSNAPGLADAKTFTVIVNEVNTAPVLNAVTNQIVNAGATLTFTNTATDADFPANVLTFSLDPGTPAAAAIGASNGIFTWTAPQTLVLLTNAAFVRVTDNGSPPLSDTRSVTMVVIPPPRCSGVTASDGNLSLTWQTYPGKTYRVQYKNALTDLNWTNLGSDIPASGPSVSTPDTIGTNTQRFYRIQQLD